MIPEADKTFSFIYQSKDSSCFFPGFIARQDEAEFVWRESSSDSLRIVQQRKTPPQKVDGLISELGVTGPLIGKERQEVHSDWLTAVLLLLLVIYTWMAVSYKKRLSQIIQAAVSYRMVNQMMREGNLSREFINIILNICFLISVSVVIFLSATHWYGLEPASLSGLIWYIRILLIVSAYFVVRNLMHAFVGFIFKTRADALEYLVNSYLVNHLTSLISFPLIILAAYSNMPLFLYASIALLILSVLYNMFRSGFVGVKVSRFSILYLFLYLCTLEILPLLIIIKAVDIRYLS